MRHGAEGNARETLAQRKKLLNSISMGKREVDRAEIEAIVAGEPPTPPGVSRARGEGDVWRGRVEGLTLTAHGKLHA